MTCLAVSLLAFDYLEYRVDLLDCLYRNVADIGVTKVDVWVLLLATTACLFRLDVDVVGSLAVLKQLSISVEALVTIVLFALVELGLRVSSVVLSSVTARSESSIAKLTLERSLASMHPFMHLEIGLVSEFFSTHTFLAYQQTINC